MTTAIEAKSLNVRKINFGHEKERNRYYFAGNPLLTHFMNSMHSVFPDGERFFIRSVKAFDAELRDSNLQERVKGFIGQEIQHGIQHQKFIQTLDTMGLKATEWTQWYARDAYERHEKFLLGAIGWLFDKRSADIMALSVTAALEHYTASIAEYVLKNPDITEGMSNDIRQMFFWHAAEEIEHKAVAFDVYEEVSGKNYPARGLGMVAASFYLAYYLGLGWGHYLLADKEKQRRKWSVDFLESLPRFARFFSGVIPLLLKYMKPGFHPDQTGSDALAEDFFKGAEKYFSERSAS